jgi:hypothetical protein
LKIITLTYLFFLSGSLVGSMWINPVSEVIFGPCDILVNGGIDIAVTKDNRTLKEKAAGVYFDTASRVIFTGSSEDTLKNIYAMNNVTINKPSGNLTIMQHLNVSGNINFVQGNVVTGTDTLVLYSGTSTVTGESASGYTVGNLRASRFIGTGTSVTRQVISAVRDL